MDLNPPAALWLFLSFLEIEPSSGPSFLSSSKADRRGTSKKKLKELSFFLEPWKKRIKKEEIEKELNLDNQNWRPIEAQFGSEWGALGILIGGRLSVWNRDFAEKGFNYRVCIHSSLCLGMLQSAPVKNNSAIRQDSNSHRSLREKRSQTRVFRQPFSPSQKNVIYALLVIHLFQLSRKVLDISLGELRTAGRSLARIHLNFRHGSRVLLHLDKRNHPSDHLIHSAWRERNNEFARCWQRVASRPKLVRARIVARYNSSSFAFLLASTAHRLIHHIEYARVLIYMWEKGLLWPISFMMNTHLWPKTKTHEDR